MFKVVKFRPPSGKTLYVFILYILLRQIIVVGLLPELQLRTVFFREEKLLDSETKQEDVNKL